MRARSLSIVRVAATLLVFTTIFLQGAAFAGPVGKKGFSKRELDGFDRLEAESKQQVQKVRGRSGQRLFKPRRVLAVAAIVGLGVWAANSDGHEDECIINGRRIDPHSSECRNAAHLAEQH